MSVCETETATGFDWAMGWPGAALLRRVRARYEARRVVARLRSLDDHLLRDIGLSRAEVDALDR